MLILQVITPQAKFIFSHLRDSIFRDGCRLEHDSSGAEMEFTFKFILSRTWGSGQIKLSL